MLMEESHCHKCLQLTFLYRHIVAFFCKIEEHELEKICLTREE